MTKAKNEKRYVWKDLKKKTTKQRNSRIEEKVKADKMKDTDFITFPDWRLYVFGHLGQKKISI